MPSPGDGHEPTLNRLRLGTSFATNAAGYLIPAVLTLLFTPLYIGKLGPTTFGLLGFFIVFEQFVAFVCVGYSQAFQRVLVRIKAREGSGLVTTHRRAARMYTLLGAGIGLILAASAYPIGRWWLADLGIGLRATVTCLALIGLRIGISLPWSIHQGVMLALGRQEAYNAIHIATVTTAGVVGLSIVLLTGSLPLFCLSQVIISAAMLAIITREAKATAVGTGDDPRHPGVPLLGILREGFALLGVNIASLLMLTGDRLFVGRLPGKAMGIYHVGSAPARILWMLLQALYVATLPRTTRIATIGGRRELATNLTRIVAVAATILAGIGISGMFYAEAFLTCWLGRPDMVPQAVAIMQWLVASMIIHAVGSAHYYTMVATKAERVTMYASIVTTPFYIASLMYILPRHGIIGAAQMTLGVRTALALVNVLYVHLVLMRGRILLPCAWSIAWRFGLAVGVAWASRALLPPGLNPWLQLATGVGAGTLTLALCGAAVARSELRRTPTAPSAPDSDINGSADDSDPASPP